MNQIFPLMQPILINQPPSSSQWIHQIKYDGVRILCVVQSSSVQLWTRNQKQRNIQYPEIKEVNQYVKANSFILDGEVIVRDQAQKPQFSLILRRDRSSKIEKIKQLMTDLSIEYQIFDLLMKNGEDLRGVSLKERQAILNDMVQPNHWLKLVKSYVDGLDLLSQVKEAKIEGIVSKDIHSNYMKGKFHKHWYKTKVKQQMLCVAGGVQYKNDFPNALLLGVYNKEKLRYVGKVAAGFTDHEWQLIHTFVPQLSQERSSFAKFPVFDLPIRWMKPQLTLLVEYTELTEDGIFRHPKMIGFTQSSPQQARWKE